MGASSIAPWIALGALVVVAAAVFAAVSGDAGPSVVPFTLTSDVTGDVALARTFSPAAGRSRPIYRHSVIAGGVYSSEELLAATESDPVVFAQYGSTAGTAMRIAPLPRPRRVYMSYRIDDRIYWTRNKVLLDAGEMTLTNGDIEIRARCGNRISDTEMLPATDSEPDAVEFDLLVADVPDIVDFDALVADEPGPPAWFFAFPPSWMGDTGGASPGVTLPDLSGTLPFGPGAPGTGGGVSGPPGAPGTSTSPTPDGPPLPPTVVLPGERPDSTTPTLDPPWPPLPPGDDFPPPRGYPPPGEDLPPPGDYLPPPEVPTVTPVPEPGTFVLLGAALAGLAAMRLRQRARRGAPPPPPR